jgi:hypothetical protein
MAVERSRWSDERLDDLAVRMNDQYAELIAKIDRLDARMDRFEARMDRFEEKVDRLRSEFYTTRLTVVGIWIGLAAIFIEIALRT